MIYPLRLETARLWTRALTMEDQDLWAAFLAHPEATRYLPNPEGYSPQLRAQLWMEKQLGRYADQQYGVLALIHKETGAFIGQCGLITQTVDDLPELEVGYHIFPQYWRQGYASEAAKAFRDLAFENRLCESVISIIHRHNIGSQAVARNNGMQQEKATQFRELDVFVFRIWHDQWLQLKNNPAPSAV
jgi:[ribosomal protein S5]-alanine N-acetyltransferase